VQVIWPESFRLLIVDNGAAKFLILCTTRSSQIHRRPVKGLKKILTHTIHRRILRRKVVHKIPTCPHFIQRLLEFFSVKLRTSRQNRFTREADRHFCGTN
jgi:hypothetical protein